MKVCTMCGIKKEERDFYIRKNRKKEHKSECKECTKKLQREYRLKNKDIIQQKDRNRWTKRRDRDKIIRRKKALVKKQKYVNYLGGMCSICKYNKCLAALDFHHKNPKEKKFMITSGTYSWKTIKKELNKCILICSNCHKELHYKQIN